KRNKGAAGIDDMTVNDLLPYLRENKMELIASLREGKYKPVPVKRVEIPKPNGGVRRLGIPTVVDRMVQQAVAQILTPIF
ncbi:RNA-directed DNA polymerase, partial [Limosilactobacillus reuteri]|nr:RNA-directed DNA polymerase [Limosilactobacillus reuteri]